MKVSIKNPKKNDTLNSLPSETSYICTYKICWATAKTGPTSPVNPNALARPGNGGIAPFPVTKDFGEPPNLWLKVYDVTIFPLKMNA